MIQPRAVSPDSLRAILRQVFADHDYDWREAHRPFEFLQVWWNDLVDWLARTESRHAGLFQVIVWGLVALLAAIALHAIWILVRTVRQTDEIGTATPNTGLTKREAGWFAREADRLAAAGRFAAAIQADFVRLVLELDQVNLLRFHPSKTPREYLPEVAAEHRGAFAALVRDLYRYGFAGVECGPAEYRAWKSRTGLGAYATAH